MNDQPHGGYQQQAVYEDRLEARERRDEYNQHHPNHHQAPYPQQAPNSPPTSASPFAFAPPPLSSVPGPGSSRPSNVPPMHHSDPASAPPQHQQQPYGAPYYQSSKQPPPQPVHQHGGYASYPGSAPMAYRSYSGESPRQSPQQAPLTRAPSLGGATGSVNGANGAAQPSPTTTGPYPYNRQNSGPYPPPMQQSPHTQSPQRPPMYPAPYYAGPYGQPTAADMPRSLSYPSNYAPGYPGYPPSMSAPSLVGHPPPTHPHLARHNTTPSMGEGMSGMDLGRQGPSLGYSFANRLPLVDRPFKCDECVQSFNRNHDLKRHKRIHLSVKPFGCDKCGKTFSRKDALRRHWLVKGCRGEDGATAPITPMYPINSQPPALSPPTPPEQISPTNTPSQGFPSSNHMSYSHPSAPPPLTTLPPRQPSDNSQIIVTPNDIPQQQMTRSSAGEVSVTIDEALVIDPALANTGPASARTSHSSGDGVNGYFEGVVGIKGDGTALLEKTPSNGSPYSRYPPPSPQNGAHHHPYRRPLLSPGKGHASPTSLGPDGKPMFAMPFSGHSYQHDGMLAPPIENGVKMEKSSSQASEGGDPASWQPQRWHRPSFPFPPPPGSNYNYDPSHSVEVGGHAYNQ